MTMLSSYPGSSRASTSSVPLETDVKMDPDGTPPAARFASAIVECIHGLESKTWMAGYRRAKATPSFGRLCPAMTMRKDRSAAMTIHLSSQSDLEDAVHAL